MWLILSCFAWCELDDARRNEWSAEAALADRWKAMLVHDELEDLQGVRFESQRQCLRALRRAMPEREYEHADPQMGFRIYTNVQHHPDYVEDFNFTNFAQVFYLACFREAPLVG